MILAYKIMLLIIIMISFIFVFGSKKDEKDLARNSTALCIAAILSFIISSLVL